MSVNSSLLREMIEAIVAEEFTLGETSIPSDSRSLKALADKEKHAHLGDMNPENFEKFLQNLVKRKYNKATLLRPDMEKLDVLTRWMNYLPGGHQYRRGLAKYLRSKRDGAQRDPFRDFRRYQSQADMTQEDVDPTLTEKATEPTVAFYHGTSANLKPGDLVLPPDKTGKVSEKGRKKNLDLVFFTKDPRSALIYAGRASQSLGGTAAVYLVEPQGPVGELNGTPGTTVYVAPYAKVIRQIRPEELRKRS